MATYATLAQLKTYLYKPGSTDTTQDTLLNDALETASRWIDHHCSRKFDADTSATARVFRPQTCWWTKVDDFLETASLVVKTDPAGNGTYSTTLVLNTDFTVEPVNGVVDGETGWPYYRIVAVTSPFLLNRVPSLQVTAKWGWTAVPGPIKMACILLAEETFKLKGAPFGVANSDQFGPIRVRENPKILAMLAPYRKYTVMVA